MHTDFLRIECILPTDVNSEYTDNSFSSVTNNKNYKIPLQYFTLTEK